VTSVTDVAALGAEVATVTNQGVTLDLGPD